VTHLVIASGGPHVDTALHAGPESPGGPDTADVVVLDLEAEDGANGTARAAESLGVRTIKARDLAAADLEVTSAVVVEPAAAHAVAIARALHDAGCPVSVTALAPEVTLVQESASHELLAPLRASLASAAPGRSWSLRAALRRAAPWAADGTKSLLIEDYPGRGRPDRQAMAELRDTHRGQTCVIIGNGPSLNKIDFALLPGVATFGVNSLFLARDRMGFDPTFYVVEDTAVMADNLDAVRAVRAGSLKLFPAMYRETLDDKSVGDTVFFTMNRGFYSPDSPNFCTPRFSTAAEERVYAGQSVTLINLQLAYHLGFSRVALIGMDFSYVIPDSVVREGNVFTSTEDDPNHFDPRYFGAGKKWKDPQLERVKSNYELARQFFEADGREIVNATVGGSLEVFPRLTLEDTLAGKPAPTTV